MVGFYKVLFNYDLQMQTMIEKLFCFLIEKYYNTAASYACATQVQTATSIVV